MIKANIYVTDMETYDDVDEVYERYVSKPYLARAAVEVPDLTIDIGVEIEVVGRVE